EILPRLDRIAIARTSRPLPWPALPPIPYLLLRSVAPGRRSAAQARELSRRTVVSAPAIVVVAARTIGRPRSRSHTTTPRSHMRVASFAHLGVEGYDGARLGPIGTAWNRHRCLKCHNVVRRVEGRIHPPPPGATIAGGKLEFERLPERIEDQVIDQIFLRQTSAHGYA